MSLAKKFGQIDFGEINNSSVTQFTDSFNTYFSSEDLSDKFNILKEFGSFNFGEIGNLMLSDFKKALIQFLYGEDGLFYI
jgi:hypothetical protein